VGSVALPEPANADVDWTQWSGVQLLLVLTQRKDRNGDRFTTGRWRLRGSPHL